MNRRILEWDKLNQEECFDLENGMSLMDTQLLLNGVLHGSAPETSGELRNVLQLYSNQPNFYSQAFPNEIYGNLVHNINPAQLNLTETGVQRLTQNDAELNKTWLENKTRANEIAEIYYQKIDQAKERGDWVTVANLKMGLDRRGQPSKSQRIQNLVDYSFHSDHGRLVESVKRLRDKEVEIMEQEEDKEKDPYYQPSAEERQIAREKMEAEREKWIADKQAALEKQHQSESIRADTRAGLVGEHREEDKVNRERVEEARRVQAEQDKIDKAVRDQAEADARRRSSSKKGGRRRSSDVDFGGFDKPEHRDKSFTPEQQREHQQARDDGHRAHPSSTSVHRGSVRTSHDRDEAERQAIEEAYTLMGQGGREGQGIPKYREEGYDNAMDWVRERLKEGGEHGHQRREHAPHLSQEQRDKLEEQHTNPHHHAYHDDQHQAAIEQARIHEEQIAMERAASHPVSGDDMIHQRSDRDSGEHFRQYRHQTSGGLDVDTVGGQDSDRP